MRSGSRTCETAQTSRAFNSGHPRGRVAYSVIFKHKRNIFTLQTFLRWICLLLLSSLRIQNVDQHLKGYGSVLDFISGCQTRYIELFRFIILAIIPVGKQLNLTHCPKTLMLPLLHSGTTSKRSIFQSGPCCETDAMYRLFTKRELSWESEAKA